MQLNFIGFLLQLYKNVAERGKWGEKLMEAHHQYRDFKFNEAFITYAPVSYTHLDVYKRQVLGYPMQSFQGGKNTVLRGSSKNFI